MRNRGGLWMVIAVMLLLDWYVFQAVKVLASGVGERGRLFVYTLYWVVSAAAIIFFLAMPYITPDTWPKTLRNYLFATFVGIFIAKLLAAVFFLIDDVRRAFTWVASKLLPENYTSVNSSWNLSRSAFLSWLGIGAGGSFLGVFFYGFSNKYAYKVNRIKLSSAEIPAGFKGFRLVHISDIHSGSFDNKEAVSKGIDKILAEKPDIVVFTGDLVNDHADEMTNYIDVFSRIKAPLGVYSTLGNHDYGDYVNWETLQAKRNNLEAVKQTHATMGWRLLMNEHIVLEKNGDKIALLGIENWGAKGRFPKYGNLKAAYAGTEQYQYKILLSHDPSHWDAQVVPEYNDINLMLAGHTHGMQFGLETPFVKWSPVQWMYKQWAGLYQQGKQYLYVNRGFGFIGYPGRVGIMPEITVIDFE